MRIAFVSVQTPAHVVGGMAGHTVFLGRLLARLGHEVTLLTTAHPEGRTVEAAHGFETRFLGGTCPGSQRGGWWRESVRAFTALHAERPFDVILSQSTAAAALATALSAAARPPIVVVLHGTTPQMLSSIATTVVGTGGHVRALPHAVRKMVSTALGFWQVDRPLYARAAALIAMSELVTRSVARWFPHAAARVHLVPYAIDTTLFAPDAARRRTVRAELGIADADSVLLCVGILSAQKGVHVAIDALARARVRRPRLRLVVVGDGDATKDLHRRARRAGLADAVRFVGRVSHDVTADYYKAADVFIMPTLRVESFGLVLAEAMACELPVVASRVGATPEVVADGETGVLVPPGRPAALADAILAVLRDPARARALGRAGRLRVRARWDETSHARAVERVMRDAIDAR